MFYLKSVVGGKRKDLHPSPTETSLGFFFLPPRISKLFHLCLYLHSSFLSHLILPPLFCQSHCFLYFLLQCSSSCFFPIPPVFLEHFLIPICYPHTLSSCKSLLKSSPSWESYKKPQPLCEKTIPTSGTLHHQHNRGHPAQFTFYPPMKEIES